jgi:hypothetical protein
VHLAKEEQGSFDIQMTGMLLLVAGVEGKTKGILPNSEDCTAL